MDQLKPGQGGILRDVLTRLAACRDMEGVLHVQSGVCTHLGCHVNWNSTEQYWDCPCHGLQFGPDGSVLNGPALPPLPQAEAPAERKVVRSRCRRHDLVRLRTGAPGSLRRC